MTDKIEKLAKAKVDDYELNTDIVAEELTEDKLFVADCASTASTVSCGGSCVGTVGSISSVVSCGEQQLR